jgi:hypothetical protein
MNNSEQFWYVVRQADGTCQVAKFDHKQIKTPEQKQWGAYDSESEAIAKKIGLIRAGQCKPQ